MHIASSQDVLDTRLAAVSAVLASREEKMHWLHEAYSEGFKLTFKSDIRASGGARAMLSKLYISEE